MMVTLDGIVIDARSVNPPPIWNIFNPSIVSPPVNITWVRDEQMANAASPFDIYHNNNNNNNIEITKITMI